MVKARGTVNGRKCRDGGLSKREEKLWVISGGVAVQLASATERLLPLPGGGWVGVAQRSSGSENPHLDPPPERGRC